MPLQPKFSQLIGPQNIESFSLQMLFKVLLKHYHLGTHSSQTQRCLLLLYQQAQIHTSLHLLQFDITKSPAFVQINVVVVTWVTSQKNFKGHYAIYHLLLSWQKEMRNMCQGGTWVSLGQRMIMMGRASHCLQQVENEQK